MARTLFALAACVGLFALPAISSAQVIQDANAQTPRADVNFPSDPDGAIRRARERIAAGDLDGAIKGLEPYVTAHPREATPKRFLGDLYFRRGEFSRAELTYYAILQIYPNDLQTHNRLGTVFAMENHVDEAIAQFNAALPGTDSVSDLVDLHERKGDLDAYSRRIRDEAARSSADPGAQVELGQLEEALHHPQAAVPAFLRALALDAQSVIALNGLGLAYLDQHQYANALWQFQSCLMIDAENYSCLVNIGATDLENGSYGDAEHILTRAQHLDPERPEALIDFGYLADMRGNWHQAIDDYAQAIAISPYARESYVDIGLDYEAHGLYALAIQALTKGIAAVPEDGRIHFLLGRAYELTGQRDLAAKEFRIAVASLDPTVVHVAQQSIAELQNGNPH